MSYNTKKSTSVAYSYYCSQRDCMNEKPKENLDTKKQHDWQLMEHFSCNGVVKITFYENSESSNIEIHHILHSIQPNIAILPEIKSFILDNIDLLPREIYKRLIEHGLNINIHQKQIHFWWTELGKNRYKQNEDSFLSAQTWLKEKSYQIIFQKESSKAFGFLTNLWKIVNDSQLKINEIGVDATCKYIFFFKFI